MDNNIEHKMIQIADAFAEVAEHLKQELESNAYAVDEERYLTNKIKYNYLTELSNIMANHKVDAQEEYNND
ncbi:hypothetical protein [Vibrio owensii]|uniref:hypothetical protein n=1 Tax=Vibrio owensii TaxID=696485 RepID=UPI0040689378